jgi:uncharacterized protein
MKIRGPLILGVFSLSFLELVPAFAQRPAASYSPPKGIHYEKQTIMSEGTRLAAELFFSKSLDGKKLPTIILCHGWGGTAAALRPEAIAFARAGYLAVAFDYRGWGESDGRVVLTKALPASAAAPIYRRSQRAARDR